MNLLLSCGFRSCIFCTVCFSVSTLSSPLFPSHQLKLISVPLFSPADGFSKPHWNFTP